MRHVKFFRGKRITLARNGIAYPGYRRNVMHKLKKNSNLGTRCTEFCIPGESSTCFISVDFYASGLRLNLGLSPIRPYFRLKVQMMLMMASGRFASRLSPGLRSSVPASGKGVSLPKLFPCTLRDYSHSCTSARVRNTPEAVCATSWHPMIHLISSRTTQMYRTWLQIIFAE